MGPPMGPIDSEGLGAIMPCEDEPGQPCKGEEGWRGAAQPRAAEGKAVSSMPLPSLYSPASCPPAGSDLQSAAGSNRSALRWS